MGLFAHRTPPYTRSKTIGCQRGEIDTVDMVSINDESYSIKVFWDYCPEDSCTPFSHGFQLRRLTRYHMKIWHGQAPKLSFLKKLGLKQCDISVYNPSENKVFVAQNVEFFENDLIDLKAIELPPNARTVGRSGFSRKRLTWMVATISLKLVFLVKQWALLKPTGFDYEETFSLVVTGLRAIRILIAIAGTMTMELCKWMSKLPSSMDIFR
ncbi:hypothetical protein Tco_0454182 [Tanacetum coccineum]